MLTKHFYHIIDQELEAERLKHQADPLIKKHSSAIDNQKSYVLLIWFLKFYGRISNYTDFITDGNNDSSCDIVFNNTNNQGETVFYVVQSKWNNEKNSETDTHKTEILTALNDFETILRIEKKNINPKLKKKLAELNQHLKANGSVKFIFLTLSQYTGAADDNIKGFIHANPKTQFEVIDINRIKSDYIDRVYKKIDPINPLENYYNPEESPVSLEIVQKNGTVKIEKPFEAYMLLLRPKSIHDLFEKYGFALFYKNVRNPLLQSQFNTEIESTAIENPAYFWYYNNGITAITYLLPEIGKKAEKIELTGLQIINGAQTVYAIYRAYKNASPTKRKQINNEALITLRLLKSGGKDFDLNVTRYTNSQNPVDDRDFCANDDIQIMLQHASYQTNIWYEKRRDEFRETLPDPIRKISNAVLAEVYLAYQLQDPVSVFNNRQLETDFNFISHKAHKQGLYETIFNDATRFADMLCAFYVFDAFSKIQPQPSTSLFYLLALAKIAFNKYLQAKWGNAVNVNQQIIRLYEAENQAVFVNIFKFLNQFIAQQTAISDHQAKTTLPQPLFKPADYEKIKQALEDLAISVQDIEDHSVEG